MFAAQYPTPPPGYAQYEYRSPEASPSGGAHGYYSPRYSVHTATPSPRGSPKVHARRMSQDQAGYGYTRVPPNYAGFSSPRYYATHQSTPQRAADYVSDFDRIRQFSQRFRAEEMRPVWAEGKHRGSGDSKRHRKSRSSHYVYKVVVDDDADRYYDSPPPPYEPYERYHSRRSKYGDADHYDSHDQVPVYTEEEPTATRSRARRASHSTRQTPTSSKSRPTQSKSHPKATEEDARRAGIPSGFCYKNWDPTEEPIKLLGSVFDANSLGKWIYDWTVFHYGVSTPMSDIAGELWLLLIQLAGKVKRAEEAMRKIRKQESREMVEDFLESGERLWIRFEKLLKSCEDYMMRAAKKETGHRKPVAMGKNSGCEFVDSIFGRDRELEKTEKMMTGMRLWSMRFDANCEEILRNPSA